MTHTRATLTRLALVVAPLLLPLPAGAEAPAAPASQTISLRTPEPASVRVAARALRDACANWPKEAPVSLEVARAIIKKNGTPIDALFCDTVVDPNGFRLTILIVGIVVAVISAGVFTAAFVAVLTLLRVLSSGLLCRVVPHSGDRSQTTASGDLRHPHWSKRTLGQAVADSCRLPQLSNTGLAEQNPRHAG